MLNLLVNLLTFMPYGSPIVLINQRSNVFKANITYYNKTNFEKRIIRTIV